MYFRQSDPNIARLLICVCISGDQIWTLLENWIWWRKLQLIPSSKSMAMIRGTQVKLGRAKF